MSTVAMMTTVITRYHQVEIGCGPTVIVQFFQVIEYELLTINETLKLPLMEAIPETLT